MTSRILGAIAAALLLTTLPAQAEPFRLIVTDLETPLVPNSVMDLAVQQGYFDREGVEVELVRVQQTPSALAAIQAGEGEMANIGVDALLLLVAGGASDLRAVVSPNKSLPFLIASKEEVATAADLAGRSFGVGRPGSLDQTLSARVMAANGIDTDGIEFVALGQPNVRAQALVAGQVDATTISIGVWSSIPDKSGLHVLIDQDAYYRAAPQVSKVNIVTEKVLEERRDDVKKVITALIKASRDYAADSGVWVSAMQAALPNIEKATLDELGTSFAKSWSVNGGLSKDELDATVIELYKGEDFASLHPVTLDEWVDFSIVDEVLADLGTEDSMDPATR
ncbi:ABC transporter substrate-binding protein [Devosia faecipullorum]|uniref:ABC transporter substrate-binding protein n=1 Tax=Devosia faecipullorum TaxID=2755039 RepID=UPI00187B1709|nr:ABC transporter substrate-binding protein [Devosia faecipullorum]MBE7733182.1 ABC transporter substrate-binding protein [Devosia faecipullorum]